MSDPLINLDAEAIVLGMMLAENANVDRMADILTPSDFHEPLHGMIFELAVQQVSQGKSATAVSLKGFFGESLSPLGGPGYLARLEGDSTHFFADLNNTARLLADLAHRRAMRSGLATAAEACADLSATVPEIVSHADAAISTPAGDGVVEMSAGECVTALIKSFSEERQGVTSGIECLDALLGPMRPKQLVIGAGRPGMGKTAWALSYGLGAARKGHGVMFVSLEMSGVELAARMVADQCFDGQDRVAFSAIRDGNLREREYARVCQAQREIHDLPFKVIDTGSLAVGRLNMLIRRNKRRMAAQGQKLELVIVDYLQLLSPDNKGRSNYEAVSEVSRALKAMAKDHGVAILALAQLSREVEKRPGNRPQLSDLRDSGQIEQDADAVLFLLREEYYLRQQDPETVKDPDQHEAALRAVEGLIEFILAKRRNGVTGTTTGRFFGVYQAVRG